MSQQVKINPADVLDMLAQGKTRDEIGEHYGLSKADCKRMFQHPDLKGKKTKKKPGFVFVEETKEVETTDTVEDTAQDVAEATTETSEEVAQGPGEAIGTWQDQ